MKVSIIGAGRNRNGIGEYIGKYFHKNGATVVSVLGTTEKTTRDACSVLKRYGIEATPYTNFYEMVESERFDTVVIASPSSTHYEYLVKCVNSGINIFCEKPFIWHEIGDIRIIIEDIFRKANEKKLTVAMNSQWPFSIEYYEKICGKIEIQKADRFFIGMSPFFSGKEMIQESVPHALSILYFVFGEGKILDLVFESAGGKEMLIRFKYVFKARECEVLIKLVRKKEQPRDFRFGFNDKIVRRSLDLKNYHIYLTYGNKRVKIVDPLELSVKNFIEAFEKKVEPLIGYPHILNNMFLLKQIYGCYEQI